MKRSRINPISKKKAAQVKAEKPIRQQLFDRANGHCENCHSDGYPFGLHPHEIKCRGLGGELSLANSLILCNICHGKVQRHEIYLGGLPQA